MNEVMHVENMGTVPGTQCLVNIGYSAAHFTWVRKVTLYLCEVERMTVFCPLEKWQPQA